VVRLQNEREHSVVATGIYSVVRHPMYAGNPLVNVGLSFWLGSYTAALFAAIPLGLLIVRIGLEERFLRRELPGYGEYAVRVPSRLLPGIW
jgi:protein-S-isoprenylcysteine O-methyltransferase Ste14